MRTFCLIWIGINIFFSQQLIIDYLAWNWNKTMELKCQIFEETFLQFASCLLSHRWLSALVTTKNVFKSRLFATNLPALPGDIRENVCHDQTEMSQFRVTCYCEMISISLRLAACVSSSITYFPSPLSKSLFYSYVRCGVSWGMICVSDVGIVSLSSWNISSWC